MGKSTIKWPFSIAMLNYQRVRMKLCPLSLRLWATVGSDGIQCPDITHYVQARWLRCKKSPGSNWWLLFGFGPAPNSQKSEMMVEHTKSTLVCTKYILWKYVLSACVWTKCFTHRTAVSTMSCGTQIPILALDAPKSRLFFLVPTTPLRNCDSNN